jgi:hypothetical protein
MCFRLKQQGSAPGAPTTHPQSSKWVAITTQHSQATQSSQTPSPPLPPTNPASDTPSDQTMPPVGQCLGSTACLMPLHAPRLGIYIHLFIHRPPAAAAPDLFSARCCQPHRCPPPPPPQKTALGHCGSRRTPATPTRTCKPYRQCL